MPFNYRTFYSFSTDEAIADVEAEEQSKWVTWIIFPLMQKKW